MFDDNINVNLNVFLSDSRIIAGKDLVKNPGRGNVYIEDANSTK